MSNIVRIGQHPYHDDPNCPECPNSGDPASPEGDLWGQEHPFASLAMGLIGVAAFMAALWLMLVMFTTPGG